MSGNTWSLFGTTQLPHELLNTTKILKLSPQPPKKGPHISNAKSHYQENGIISCEEAESFKVENAALEVAAAQKPSRYYTPSY
ncbi:hypothetical protein AOL_s00054g556 [Orbilia oligospora ATCC 24927]|uniref:Uncharacterized protein n=2 Tax=Orbilia oligospora TaxID=2813651 RepID=G1X6R2_ARTOA|nr:hypothetical protein AOL_s00054g556 [Orbilia oligospora ATCC 24927]EGX51180.1 hypothetical protein AOL_s00054g556 [Orbilia oligospora ATCC 24927]KAF3279821.1 hypothetical protein TWF970_003848 [Orbilia oligospora]